MKRFLTLIALMLTLTLALALCACGGDETPTDDPAADPGQSEVENDPAGTDDSTDPAQTAGVDLEALKAQMIADSGITDYIDVPAENLASVYNLGADSIVNAAAFNAMAGGAFPEEIVMIQAVNEDAATEMATQLEARLTQIADQAASYDPVSLELAENCPVVTSGCYVGLFFTTHYDAMTAAFTQAVG